MSLQAFSSEPTIAVGLVEEEREIALRLEAAYLTDGGQHLAPGEYRVRRRGSETCLLDPAGAGPVASSLRPVDPPTARFSLETTIGIDFHWQERATLTFSGGLRFLPRGMDRITVVNDVSLETYLASVICSEMSADSPPELARAHAVISRSWIVAQLAARGRAPEPPRPTSGGERIRWYDREEHGDFDVCADDHCQRYQGLGRITNPRVLEAFRPTRGQILTHGGEVCDARFSKCCGGVTEDFRVAWADTPVPYLVPVADTPERRLPEPPLTSEKTFRAFLEAPSTAHCSCRDERILKQVLPSLDQRTTDFFRWQVRLSAEDATQFVREKGGLELGRIVALVPLARGLSGRIWRLRIRGESGECIVGKELEVRRLLSRTHLLSAAFVVDPQGPAGRPEAFVLSGAGWGHGVGLCQIGAAVLAARGRPYAEILAHYYPGTGLTRAY